MKKFLQLWGAMALAIGMSGCANSLVVGIKDPTSSTLAYSKIEKNPAALTFEDGRTTADKIGFSSGTLAYSKIEYKGTLFDAFPYMVSNTTKELLARGLPVKAAGTENIVVRIKSVHSENSRTNGYTPLITFTTLVAELQTPAGNKKISAYVKRGKVPIWGFEEIVDPCYNDALSILVKETAAKINKEYYNGKISDTQVDALVAKISKEAGSNPDSYLDVYQLGFGNNARAIPKLVEFTHSTDEYVRLAAISSLGILGAKEQLPYLISIYQDKGDVAIWQDRGMALKAIGDLNTDESKAFLKEAWTALDKEDSKAARWEKGIIALYI